MNGWAIVTGAAGDIGRAVVDQAVRQGYRVAAWDIDRASLAQLAGDGIDTKVVDVTDEAAVEAAVADLLEPPTLVVNNAALVRYAPLVDLALEDWETVIRLNLTGTFLTARAAARRMAEAGGGSIVNMSAVNCVAPVPNSGAATASKAAVVVLSEQMALEWAGMGIRVNAVSPGLIDAGISLRLHPDAERRKQRAAQVPLGRAGTVDDVAHAVMFLASPQSSYITGQNIIVDGGVSRSALQRTPKPAALVE